MDFDPTPIVANPSDEEECTMSAPQESEEVDNPCPPSVTPSAVKAKAPRVRSRKNSSNSKKAPVSDSETATKNIRKRRKQRKPRPADSDGEPRKKKPTSVYNIFVRDEVEKIKIEFAGRDDAPSHRDRFILAADRWKVSPLNPKNQQNVVVTPQ